MTLPDALTALYAGGVEPTEVLGAFRRTTVVVPLDGRGGLWTVPHGGVWWIHAFCDEASLARFAAARAKEPPGVVHPDGAAWDYVTTWGARLLDVVIPEVGEPAGVALDVGGSRPFFLPPLAGVVPETAVVTTGGGTR
ncbi:SseB family protein [Streptomyces sp. I05A-00742]|uniref:SseB family protein n=1 Tax=Streptomyces sp. I05A-00742 TaxID=2732853 RepID=UPI0020182830